jgi:hypothetical protein
MAIDQTSINQTGFQADVAKRALLPADELVVTPGVLQGLKIDDKKLLAPENVLPFLISQSVKYHQIVDWNMVKTGEGEVAEYIHDDSALPHTQLSVSREEQAALAAWSEGSRQAMLAIQSGEATPDGLIQEIDSYIEESKKTNPGLWENFGADPTDMMIMQGLRDLEENEEELKRKLALAASSGDPELFNTLLSETYVKRIQRTLGSLLKQVDTLDRKAQEVMKDLGLNSAQAEVAKANMEFGAYSGERSTLMLLIQKAVGELERIMTDTSRTNEAIGRPLDVMIQNIRGR